MITQKEALRITGGGFSARIRIDKPRAQRRHLYAGCWDCGDQLVISGRGGCHIAKARASDKAAVEAMLAEYVRAE
jgi:hypothetical protein